jgi:hypothetical protein
VILRTARLALRAYSYATRKLLPEDEFIQWMKLINAGMLHPGNLYCLDYAIRNLPEGYPIVEIGSFCGLSANLITHLKRIHGRTGSRLYTCDKWEFEGADDGPLLDGAPTTHGEIKQHAKESFIRNTRLFSRDDLPFTVESYSDEFFDLWRQKATVTDVHGRNAQLGGYIGFCYVDGDHTYAQVSRDFANLDEFLLPGGFVMFDDSADHAGVNRVVTEVLRNKRYELVLRNPNHLFRKLPV